MKTMIAQSDDENPEDSDEEEMNVPNPEDAMALEAWKELLMRCTTWGDVRELLKQLRSSLPNDAFQRIFKYVSFAYLLQQEDVPAS